MKAEEVIKQIAEVENLDERSISKLLVQKSGSFSKSELLREYHNLIEHNQIKLTTKQHANFLNNITMKKIRTLSGVTTVTVLTKPFPCPGKCIFCPNDVRMPKSYLSSEPGAQRAETNKFDPYLQTFNRLVAYKNIGHPTDKIELIILGGTWTFYPDEYQIWFVKRCFDALNEFNSLNKKTTFIDSDKTDMPYSEKLMQTIDGRTFDKTYNQVISLATKSQRLSTQEKATWKSLFDAHNLNERSRSKCVGLVIETRPDEITQNELIRIRKLGATKIQIGIQSLNDKVLSLNKRGHDSDQTRKAINLIRQAGFKIHIHWMPNLYGSDVKLDKLDYLKLFNDLSIKPDEIKIYPCSLIESAELMQMYLQKKWKPYTQNQLADIMVHSLKETPRYCRITRVIRDIPSTDIVAGNKKTNFRQIAEEKAKKLGITLLDIHSREIRSQEVSIKNDLKLKIMRYLTKVSVEYFIEYVTSEDKIAGFVRLNIPLEESFIPELKNSAIIREVHVYGKSTEVGGKLTKGAQHKGIGKNLISIAELLTYENGFKKLSVISAIGTKEYYRKLGYIDGRLYQSKKLV